MVLIKADLIVVWHMFTEQKEVESWRQTNTFKTEMEEEKFWEKKI